MPSDAEQQVEPGKRGGLRIADRVVAKIAAQAAREALHGLPDDGNAPHATVDVHRDIARVGVTVELGYPSDIGRQCADVRRRVTERVETLAGMRVPGVSVRVERLHSALSVGARGRVR
ncbi:Asp23/Gls24 family envelope stress response protein [Streptomyces sp. GC420]|uniref:Asp23/Gls24 family envelope stress response protein n=1 Tax=Streptomyces sp. GC420 TaxID=2697568 RepID=UPI0014152F5D|nr:Asp23/Gls24 family envelope stress response protein [Streptomyces sp. GC420]NBM14798.1 hypothetical protein [Streptomyces sp. GC420]